MNSDWDAEFGDGASSVLVVVVVSNARIGNEAVG